MINISIWIGAELSIGCNIYFQCYMSVIHLPEILASPAHFTIEPGSNGHQNFHTDLLLDSNKRYPKVLQTGYNNNISRRECCWMRVNRPEYHPMSSD